MNFKPAFRVLMRDLRGYATSRAIHINCLRFKLWLARPNAKIRMFLGFSCYPCTLDNSRQQKQRSGVCSSLSIKFCFVQTRTKFSLLIKICAPACPICVQPGPLRQFAAKISSKTTFPSKPIFNQEYLSKNHNLVLIAWNVILTFPTPNQNVLTANQVP